MHPWDHARSSARIFGGAVEAYLPFHNWFDATKSAFAHFRHRALRHHREGIEEARRIFGPTLEVKGRAAVDTEGVGLQHLSEDVCCAPFARDWLHHAEGDGLPQSWPPADLLAERSAARFGGTPDIYLPLHAWFLETRHWMPDRRHLIMRHHAFGIFEAEARYGTVLWRDDGSAVPTRVIAERHVRSVLGAVPPASALLQLIRPQRWMAAATSPAKLGLDENPQARPK